jgi:hypothetical protein
MKKFTTLEKDLIKEAAGAQEAFNKSFKNANDKLLQIRVALEDFKEKYQSEPRNWGYVGSMGYVNEKLDQILEHLGVIDESKQIIADTESDIQ